jgi:hypothetical protein
MATKGVLTQAVKKLEHANMILREKLSKAPKADKDKILKELARNDSMIMDYEFRLKNNKE